MGLSPESHNYTVKIKTGNAGLWKLGEHTNKLALSWKFLEDLAREEIGVNEVEMKAWNRAANREVKKGRSRPALDKGM